LPRRGLHRATVGVRDALVKSPTRWRGVEGWEVLVAWADALAYCTSPAEPEARPAEDCPLPQDLLDILARERRLSHSPMREESPLLR
jgi:hypothetical protein